MTYVAGGGDVVAKRSLWRASIVADAFWGVVNFLGLLCVGVNCMAAAAAELAEWVLTVTVPLLVVVMCGSVSSLFAVRCQLLCVYRRRRERGRRC